MILPIICIIINIVWALYCGNLDYYNGFFPKGNISFNGFNFSSPELLIIIFNLIFLIILIVYKDKLTSRMLIKKTKIFSVILTLLFMSVCTMLVNR